MPAVLVTADRALVPPPGATLASHDRSRGATAGHPHRPRALLLRLGRRARGLPRDRAAGGGALRGAVAALPRSRAPPRRDPASAAQPARREPGDDRGRRGLRARRRRAVA